MLTTSVRRLLVILTALVTAFGLLVVVLGTPAADARPKRCHRGYPAAVTTRTTVDLVKRVGEYGDRNAALVRVRSDAGVPSGEVTLSVAGRSRTLALRGGVARAELPRFLPASHTYAVTADYAGGRCFRGSSGTAYYTVLPRRHHPHQPPHHGNGLAEVLRALVPVV
jgi:hypothetical protein